MYLCASTHICATAVLETNRCKFEAAPRLPQWLLSLDVYTPGISDFQVRRRQKQGRKYCVTTRVSANVNTWLITIWCVFSVEYMSRQSADLHLTNTDVQCESISTLINYTKICTFGQIIHQFTCRKCSEMCTSAVCSAAE